MTLRWGIISAGKISHDFVNAIGTLNTDEHHVVAVAARDLNRAEDFAHRFNIAKAYSSYLELAEDPSIEVVYVGTTNKQHFETSILMLEHGKHVLCEKPLCINAQQTQQLIAYAKERNLFLMEAIWSRCFPSYQYIREQIESGKLGKIETIEIDFGFSNLADHDAVVKKSLGGGVTINMACYTIQFCQWIFQQDPQSIQASGKLNKDGVDVEMSAEINYGDNRRGKMKISALATLGNSANIIGSKGTLTVPSFWSASSLIDVDGTTRSWPFPSAKYEFNFPNSCGLRYEADEVRKNIRSGRIESELMSHNESIRIARIEDEMRKQIGVKYPEDN